MTLSYWQKSVREPERAYDAVVVGGGVVGCSTAYWLRKLQPDMRIAVVEARGLAAGASGRNAGFVLQGTARDYLTDVELFGRDRARRLWHFTNENRQLMVSELDGAAFDFEQSGSMTVAGTEEEDERLRASVSLMRSDRISVIYHPPDEANRRLGAAGFYGALYVTSGGLLDPVALVRHLAAQSEADVLPHHPVASLREAGGRVVVETSRCRLRANAVVLAVNAHLPHLVPALGRYVRPVRAQMLATEPASTRWLRAPAYTHDGFYYVRQLPDGTLLLGGARHLHEGDEAGYEDAVTTELQNDLEAYLHRHFHRARGLDVRTRWSGTMGFSPDGLPVVGVVPECPGAIWAAGFTGHGMGYGFRFGRLLAEQALGRRTNDIDLFTAARLDDVESPVVPILPRRAAGQ